MQPLNDLRECYLKNLDHFGALHLRAYTYFSKYFRQLVRPASPAGVREPDYSMDAVMDQYLSLSDCGIVVSAPTQFLSGTF